VRNSPVITKVSYKEGEEVLQVLEQRFLCRESSPAGEAGCSPATYGGPRCSKRLHCSPWRTPCQSG